LAGAVPNPEENIRKEVRNMAMPTNQEIVQAAEEIERVLGPLKTRGAAPVDVKELCKVYNSIKDPLNALLPVIAVIPTYGAPIAAGLKVLMPIADALCPTK
jgi:hypothetical protein